MAVSVDDAGSWSTVPLPEVAADPALVARVLPVPERNTAWLVLGRPARRGQLTSVDLWVVPAADAGGTPHRVRPDDPVDGVTGGVGLKDGRLALAAGGTFTVLAQDGVTERMSPSDVDSTRYVLREPERGPHLLLVALAIRTDGVAAIATSLTGNVDDWRMRPVVL